MDKDIQAPPCDAPSCTRRSHFLVSNQTNTVSVCRGHMRFSPAVSLTLGFTVREWRDGWHPIGERR